MAYPFDYSGISGTLYPQNSVQGQILGPNTIASNSGSSGDGINWGGLLNGIGSLFSNPQVLGTGMALTGGLLDRETGTDLEARQALRNIANMSGNNLLSDAVGNVQTSFGSYLQPGPGQQYLTSLFQSPSNPFASGGLYEQYLPLIEQQKSQLLNDVQQRAIAGMPASMSTGMSGGELAAIRDATANQIAPSYQKLFADLTRENQARQMQAAQNVMGMEESNRNFVGNMAQFGIGAQGDAAANLMRLSQPDPFAESLAKLGTMLAMGGGGGFGGLGGFGGAGGGTGGNLLGSLGQIANSLGLGGQGGALSGLFGEGGALAGLGPMLGTAAGAVGSGAAGYGLGNLFGSTIGAKNDSQALGTWGGGLSGMAAGAAIGSIVPGIGTAIGAIIGGLAGAFGGFGGTRDEQHAEKAMFRSQDNDSQRDQVFEIGNIGGQFLQQFGAPAATISEWQSYVNNLAANSESPADEQGLVATRLGQLLTPLVQAQGYASLDDAPGLRTGFIDYLTKSTFTAGNSSYGGGAPINYINDWAGMVGLAEGGVATQPTWAMVGERGPELAALAPGSMVLPNQAAPQAHSGFQSMQNRLAGILPLSQALPQANALPFLNASPAASFQQQRGLPEAMMGQASPTLPTMPQGQGTPPGSIPGVSAAPAMPQGNYGIGNMVSGLQSQAAQGEMARRVRDMLLARILPMGRFATGRGIGALANA